MRTASAFNPPAQAGIESLPLPSGRRGLPFVGSFLSFMADPLGGITAARNEGGRLSVHEFGPFTYVFTHDPDDVQHVFVRNHKNYVKSRSYKGLRMIMGNGLVTSEGEFWKRQRKLSQPAFHRQRLEALANTMATAVEALAVQWTAKTERGPLRTDVFGEMMRLTLGIVGQTLFGIDLTDDANELGPAITIALTRANKQAESVFPIPLWIPTPLNVRFKRAKEVLDRIVHRIIAERRAHGRDEGDLLSMLMSASDDSGTERMTDEQLRDEVMTLFLAGHETIATAMSWTWWLLSRHPEVAARVREEIDRELGDRTITFADLPKLQYTGWVLDECMRVRPPVWIVERTAVQDDVVGGHRIPKGTIIGASPWGLHHDPRLWDAPERFDPERFSPERSEGRHKYAYVPFGAGPRICIGNAFALMESKIIMAGLMRSFTIEIDGPAPKPDPKVTMRPKHGMAGTIARR